MSESNSTPAPIPPKPDADELAMRLQESLAKRRPRPWLPVLSALVLGSLLLAFMIWWMYPRRTPEGLQVVALDALFESHEAPKASAQLLLPNEEESRRRLKGQTLVFHTQPGEPPRQIVAQSDVQGQASVDWVLPAEAAMTEFLVRYINKAERHGSMPDRGRLFVWPKDSSLLLVDAEETLIQEVIEEDARANLQKAAEEGWHIAYLALGAATAEDLRTARGWIQTQPRLALGPVLGRPLYPAEDTHPGARRALLKSLQSRFTGPMVIVVKREETALECKSLGLRTILIGNAAPPGVIAAPTWVDVPSRLK